MNPAAQTATAPDVIKHAADQACALIAPTWPLDRWIAVNPWWPMIDQDPAHCHARLAARAGARAIMPRAYFRELWREGRITERHLRGARAENGDTDIGIGELVAHLDRPAPTDRIQLVTDLLDAQNRGPRGISWRDEVVHQVSQFCAAAFDQGQARWSPAPDRGLYATWRQRTAADRGMAILMGKSGLHRHFAGLPASAGKLIAAASEAMGLERDSATACFHALLLSVNGWASWCAFQGWPANADGGDNDTVRELLAIRLAWEWVLFDHVADAGIRLEWHRQRRHWEPLERQHLEHTARDWIWQRALERAYQTPLIEQLERPLRAEPEPTTIKAVFCIDVRSEVFRRALEAANPDIETGGFAGFFGLPIAYRPLGEREARPQLPGLLAPSLTVTDATSPDNPASAAASLAARQQALANAELDRRFRWNHAATFSYVEATGLLHAWKLFRDSLASQRSRRRKSMPPAGRAPSLDTLQGAEGPLTTEQQAELAETILRNLSLTRDFPALVLLAGHGSGGTNNPHQASLDCGACCGQTGEVNARLVAQLLNNGPVRETLAERGLDIPRETHFIAGLHNTTTDELTLFDTESAPAHLAPLLARLRADLRNARQTALAERAPTLGLPADRPTDLARRVNARTRDWSQVRPEWGLANNAAFIAAPRWRTRAIDLNGRTFLHDYRWREDRDFQVLENILTAPVVVAHWINMQYYASTVDNPHYGSGNKVLHNVVGGRLGVFEGNGGDLRIGLPMQSLHDGRQWRHTPVRLSVFIEAPGEAIRHIVRRHEPLRRLVDNEWLYLFRIGEDGVKRLHQEQWLSPPSP